MHTTRTTRRKRSREPRVCLARADEGASDARIDGYAFGLAVRVGFAMVSCAMGTGGGWLRPLRAAAPGTLAAAASTWHVRVTACGQVNLIGAYAHSASGRLGAERMHELAKGECARSACDEVRGAGMGAQGSARSCSTSGRRHHHRHAPRSHATRIDPANGTAIATAHDDAPTFVGLRLRRRPLGRRRRSAPPHGRSHGRSVPAAASCQFGTLYSGLVFAARRTAQPRSCIPPRPAWSLSPSSHRSTLWFAACIPTRSAT